MYTLQAAKAGAEEEEDEAGAEDDDEEEEEEEEEEEDAEDPDALKESHPSNAFTAVETFWEKPWERKSANTLATLQEVHISFVSLVA